MVSILAMEICVRVTNAKRVAEGNNRPGLRSTL